MQRRSLGVFMQARIQGGGGAGAGAHPWDGGTRAFGAGSFVSRAERRDTGVSCMIVQHHSSIICNEHLEKLQICICVSQKSLIPIPYKVINPLAPSPGRNPGSAPGLWLFLIFFEKLHLLHFFDNWVAQSYSHTKNIVPLEWIIEYKMEKGKNRNVMH